MLLTPTQPHRAGYNRAIRPLCEHRRRDFIAPYLLLPFTLGQPMVR